MEAALKARKVPMELVVYNDEGHGFLRQSKRVDFYRRFKRFVAQHLG